MELLCLVSLCVYGGGEVRVEGIWDEFDDERADFTYLLVIQRSHH